MNTRMTIVSPLQDGPCAPAGSGLARTRRQNSAESRRRRRRHRGAQHSRLGRSRGSGSLPPGRQIKAQRLPAAGRVRSSAELSCLQELQQQTLHISPAVRSSRLCSLLPCRRSKNSEHSRSRGGGTAGSGGERGTVSSFFCEWPTGQRWEGITGLTLVQHVLI